MLGDWVNVAHRIWNLNDGAEIVSVFFEALLVSGNVELGIVLF